MPVQNSGNENEERALKTADEYKYVPDDKLMNSSYIRDTNFRENRRRMDIVEKYLNMTKYFGFVSALVIGAISAGLFSFFLFRFFGLAIENAAINTVKAESEQIHVVFDFSGWLYSLITMIVIGVCSMLVGEYHKKGANIILYIAHLAYALLGLLTLLGVSDDMPRILGISILAYAIFGYLNTDRSQRALKDLDHLKTQEGYPDFNLAMYYMHQSRYVKMREEWENRDKKYDFYGEKERPVAGEITQYADGGMEGLSVGEADRDEWFKKSAAYVPEEKPQDDTAGEEKESNEISTDELGFSDEDYKLKEDRRYRPL